MNTVNDADLYETDAAYVEAWTQWAEARRKITVSVGYTTLPNMTYAQFEQWRQSGILPELDQ